MRVLNIGDTHSIFAGRNLGKSITNGAITGDISDGSIHLAMFWW